MLGENIDGKKERWEGIKDWRKQQWATIGECNGREASTFVRKMRKKLQAYQMREGRITGRGKGERLDGTTQRWAEKKSTKLDR